MAHDLYTQLALGFRNPMIAESTLETIAQYLESRLEKHPISSETVNIAISTIKGRIKDFGKNDPARNGFLRKLCLILAQSYILAAPPEELKESSEFVIKTLTTL